MWIPGPMRMSKKPNAGSEHYESLKLKNLIHVLLKSFLPNAQTLLP